MGVSTVHAIEVQQYGGPEVLAHVERPEPADIEGRVRIAVAARVVGPADILTREGAFAAFTPDLKPPFVLGWDFAGTVVSDGARLRRRSARRGTPAVVRPRRHRGDVRRHASGRPYLARADPRLADLRGRRDPRAQRAHGCARPAPGRRQARRDAPRLRRERCRRRLRRAARCGRGRARHRHRSAGDEDYVTSLGAKDVITRVDDLVGAVRTLVPQGVAAALDAATVGPALLGAVRDGGTFIAVTDPATPAAERGIRVGKVSVEPDSATLSELVRLLAAGDLTVRLADVLPLADAAEAHRRAAAGVRGKLVLSS